MLFKHYYVYNLESKEVDLTLREAHFAVSLKRFIVPVT